jgi:cyclophilin family peptidyl-prolyl cis-trans isomerase/protein-disulfide isomerase
LARHFRSTFLGLSLLILSVLVACTSTVPINSTATVSPTATPFVMPTDAPLQELFPGEFSECVLTGSVEQEPYPIPAPFTPDHILGVQDDPEIALIVYMDMQCPYCAAFHPVLMQLLEEYPDQLQITFRHLPLFMVHDKAFIAAQALEAVALQNEESYFSLQSQLLNTQSDWAALSPEEFSSYLRERLPELGIDPDQFDQDMMNETYNQNLFSELDANIPAGITSTPYLFLNEQPYTTPTRDLSSLRTIIELELLTNRQFDTCPPKLIMADKDYLAILHTTQGDIIVALYDQQAPLAVNNFIFLSQQGWYDNNPFYTVIPDQYALTGDPSGSSLGTPGYTFRTETNDALTFDRAGVVAMNNAGSPNSNGSQFFITLAAQPNWNGKFTIFGQVVEGLDVLMALAERNAGQDPTNLYYDEILSVTIDEK